MRRLLSCSVVLVASGIWWLPAVTSSAKLADAATQLDSAASILASDQATSEAKLTALTRLDSSEVYVSEKAIADIQVARKVNSAQAARAAYLQRVTEMTGETLSNALVGFNAFAIDWEGRELPGLVLRVTQESSDQARSLLDSSPVLREVELKIVRRSATQIQTDIQLIGGMAKTNAALGEAISQINTGGTYETIVIYPSSGDPKAANLISATIQGNLDLSDQFADGLIKIGEPRSAVVEASIDAVGGMNATTCTWGFVGVRNGAYVMMTAGHCPPPSGVQTYGGTTLAFVSGSEYNGYYADVQVHTIISGLVPTNDIIDIYPNRRDIIAKTTYASIPLSGVVCHTGKTTGYSCGTVTDKTGGSGYDNLFIEVSGAAIDHGDSGGPYYLGLTAYGICHSLLTSTVSYFGAMDYSEWFAATTIKIT